MFMNGHPIGRWHRRYVELARQVALWSKDPSTKVGAVLVRPDFSVASVGFNGFPRGVDDSEERLNDRPTKLMMTVHGEMNAILNAHERLNGYTLYVTPFAPCSSCAAMIIQAGIEEVIIDQRTKPRESWHESIEVGRHMFEEADVNVQHVTDEV